MVYSSADRNNITVFGLIFSRYCVAECAHCGSDSGPRHRGKMSLDLATRCVRDVAGFGVESVVITGGEPLAFVEDICRIAEVASDNGLSTQVCSNGYWAKTLEHGKKTLMALKRRGLDYLMLSTDQFHVKFVPVDRVVNAANAAEELDIPCQVAVPSMANDFTALSLMAQLQAETNAFVYSHPVHPVGRGKNLPGHLLPRHHPTMHRCELMGHVEVDWDGTVSCCPPAADYGESNALVLGNAETEPLRELLLQFQRTPLYQVISRCGPMGLLRLLEKSGTKTGIQVDDGTHECNVCQLITGSVSVFERFKKETDIDLLAPASEWMLKRLEDSLSKTETPSSGEVVDA